MNKVITVISKKGVELSPCTYKRAKKLVSRKNAVWIGHNKIQKTHTNGELKKIKNIVRSKKICYICGEETNDDNTTVDHLIPKHRGGEDTISNYKCCCERCNMDKDSRDLLDYAIHIKSNIEKYDYISNEQLINLTKLGLKYRIQLQNNRINRR